MAERCGKSVASLLAAQELAAALDQIEQRGTCPDCLAELLLMVAVGMRRKWIDTG